MCVFSSPYWNNFPAIAYICCFVGEQLRISCGPERGVPFLSCCFLCGKLRTKKNQKRPAATRTDNKEIICAKGLGNSCCAVMWSEKNRQIRLFGAALDHTLYACLMMNVPPYRVSIGKSIPLKLKQYRVVLIRRAKSKWGGFDTSLPDSSLPSNDTLSILALHW